MPIPGFLEHLPISFGYRLLRDAIAWLQGKRRRLTPQQKIELRQKWKSEFETQISERRSRKLRTDIVIRDVRRVDSYPNADDSRKGISPWFRVGLMATYHRGIEVGLHWGNLIEDAQTSKWRFVDYERDDNAQFLKVILIGYIPYENIEAVDWDGDEYYGFPHIYCYFDRRRREPYERLAFCEQKRIDEEHFYYSEVVGYEATRKLSKKRGISDFG